MYMEQLSEPLKGETQTPTEENASHKMRNCRTKTEMERERSIRWTFTTEMRQHLKMAETARDKFVAKVGKKIEFVQIFHYGTQYFQLFLKKKGEIQTFRLRFRLISSFI